MCCSMAIYNTKTGIKISRWVFQWSSCYLSLPKEEKKGPDFSITFESDNVDVNQAAEVRRIEL
jgi:hypothetical protein